MWPRRHNETQVGIGIPYNPGIQWVDVARIKVHCDDGNGGPL